MYSNLHIHRHLVFIICMYNNIIRNNMYLWANKFVRSSPINRSLSIRHLTYMPRTVHDTMIFCTQYFHYRLRTNCILRKQFLNKIAILSVNNHFISKNEKCFFFFFYNIMNLFASIIIPISRDTTENKTY